MPSLQFQAPNEARARTFDLHKRVTSIGAGDDNDLQIQDPSLADTHALVHFDGRTFTMQCVAPGGSIVVNGRPRARHPLEHGDELLLGETMMTFHLHQATARRAEAADSELAASYRKVLEFSQTLLDGRPLPELLELLMDSIIELTQADRGFLLAGDGTAFEVRVARNIAKENVENAFDKVSDSIVATVVRTREPLIVADALHDDAFKASQSVVNLKLCSVMCVPLIDRERLLGIIYVGNDNVVNLFSESHLQTLTIYAAQASLILARAIAFDELKGQHAALKERLEDLKFGSVIGACAAMRDVYRRVKRVAATDVSVLVTGETGTGKELIAKELHRRSDRANGPFVTINCGAIPENLLESELFGYVRGAFTGASSSRVGRFQAASGGTLFLDEIGEMPVNLQVKILRALQEREVMRVGDTRAESIDIRVIAATHRDLPAMIEQGTFREDLYYRLNVIALHLPALRDRGDDVVLIAQYLLERFCVELGVAPRSFSKEAIVALRKFTWPGNIRQLENHIKKAIILSDRTTIRAVDLDLDDDGTVEIQPLAEAREEWQRSYIRHVLTLNDGNRTKTARDLGVDPRTVFRFLEKETASD
jgi:transcriptional regulator with GAF, ATPase, and Fis domain